MVSERLPPQDLDAEEAVIGSLLVDGEGILKVAPFLRPEDFYRERNRWAYEAALALNERREGLNQVTLAHELAQRGQLEAAGGSAYLALLVEQLPTSVHLEHYGQIVSRTALFRRLIAASDRIRDLGYGGGPDAETAIDRAEDILYTLRARSGPRGFVSLKEILAEYFEQPQDQGPIFGGRPTGALKTGFVDLDKLLGGLQRSDLVILAARTSMGKSSLALNIARNVALNQKAHVAVFSLEMSKEQLAYRLIAAESGVDSRHVRLGEHLTRQEEERVIEATGVLSEVTIFVDDTPLQRMIELRSKARRLHHELGVDLIVVDYLQLIMGEGRNDNRVQVVSDISRSLKGLARELNVPVLALSQLSRAVEKRDDHRPVLSDLRESGSIEQDADVVAFIYREEVYNPNPEEWERKNPDKPYPKGIADVMVAKHRNGPIGETKLYFRDKLARFENLTLHPESHP